MENSIVKDFTSILNFGVIGVSLLLAYFGYLLMSRILSRDQISKGQIVLLTTYFLFCLVLAVVGFILEFGNNNNADKLRLKYLGIEGNSSFINGGAKCEAFDGLWVAHYFVLKTDSMLSSSSYKSENIFNQDTIIKYFNEFPVEQLTINSDHSIMYVKSKGSHPEAKSKFKLFGEGRFSSGSDLTFIYWSPMEDEEDQFVGVNFMHFSKDLKLGSKTKLNGWWIGRAENGEILHGITKWEKQGS